MRLRGGPVYTASEPGDDRDDPNLEAGVSPERTGSRRARFVALSVALTGDPELPAVLATAYLKRLDRAHPGDVDKLLVAYEAGLAAGEHELQAIQDRVVDDAARWSTAREVVSIWLTSRLPGVDLAGPEVVPPEQYFQGRLWVTIQAHPPGLSGGYFGHWRYEPDS